MTTGCSNGRLEDPQAYFFSLIGRIAGAPAADWQAVLEDLHFVKGMHKNPPPGAPVPAGTPCYGITVMIDGEGHARGRIWLPSDTYTEDGNGNRWYTHEIQVIADGVLPGTMVWAWQDKGGAPYAPRECDGGTEPDPEPPDPEPDPVLTELQIRVEFLERTVVRLLERMEVVEQATTPEAIRAVVQGETVQVRGAVGIRDVASSREVTWTGQVGTLPPPKR